MNQSNPWLHVRRPNPAARVRLFCFPYAGGAASIYRAWHEYLPPEIEVCAVQLPGRANRFREQPHADIDDLMAALIPALAPHMDKPFALFGHSMGAVIAYELARRLYLHGGPAPALLAVSGRRAPFLPNPEAPLHAVAGDTRLLQQLQRRYRNLPAMIFEDAELRDLFVPLLRADLALVERYVCPAATPLPCAIVACGGASDEWASHEELAAWQANAGRSFDLHQLPGGHFYLNEQIEPLLTLLGDHIEQALQAEAIGLDRGGRAAG